jgi:hypothetical protein
MVHTKLRGVAGEEGHSDLIIRDKGIEKRRLQ